MQLQHGIYLQLTVQPISLIFDCAPQNQQTYTQQPYMY